MASFIFVRKMHKTSDKTKFRSRMLDPSMELERSGIDEALQKIPHEFVQ
jgi:hypothetical protein